MFPLTIPTWYHCSSLNKADAFLSSTREERKEQTINEGIEHKRGACWSFGMMVASVFMALLVWMKNNIQLGDGIRISKPISSPIFYPTCHRGHNGIIRDLLDRNSESLELEE